MREAANHAHSYLLSQGMDNQGLAADYEYVCFGKVYKFDEGKQEIACVTVFTFHFTLSHSPALLISLSAVYYSQSPVMSAT